MNEVKDEFAAHFKKHFDGISGYNEGVGTFDVGMNLTADSWEGLLEKLADFGMKYFISRRYYWTKC